jgi:steroid delta-isomerase-like uncharacterized protein
MDAYKLSHEMLQAWKSRDWIALREVLHSDYVYTAPDGSRVVGVDAGLAAAWSSFAESFPDGDYEIKKVCVDGDTVVTEFQFTGTHTGDFEGIAPTGSSVVIDFCNVIQIKDDKVLTERDYLDTHGLLEQLGNA